MTDEGSTSITVDRVYPWGRSFDEYRAMFGLTDQELDLRIVSCADGPASFNAEMARRGQRVVSCDPLYRFNAKDIHSRVDATHEIMVELARRDAHRFVWDKICSPKDLGRVRMEAMAGFLADYEHGIQQGRYVNCSLPKLPFANDSFDLALCSHFLFLYSDEFSFEFHQEAVTEMCRIARDVRIFPLLNMRGEISVHVAPLVVRLQRDGCNVSRRQVEYEFQRGGNEMLRITRGQTWTRC